MNDNTFVITISIDNFKFHVSLAAFDGKDNVETKRTLLNAFDAIIEYQDAVFNLKASGVKMREYKEDES